MPDTKYIAIVLGSSGLIGTEILNLLLNNNKYKMVYAISRKDIPLKNEKLIPIIADYSTIANQLKDIQVDHFFSCIGTTSAKTPDKKEYYTVDLDYPLAVARILEKSGLQTICLVSSIGANPESKNFYLKLKGDVEKAMRQERFKSLHIFRPSLLLGNRKEYRLGEKIAQVIYPFLNLFLIGKLKDYRSIQAEDVASAMINAAISSQPGTHIYQTQFIKELA